MNKHTSLLLLAFAFVGAAGVAGIAGIYTVAGVAGFAADAGFTPAQKQDIGETAAAYLRTHPELLVEMSRQLQVQRRAQMQQAATEDSLTQAALLNDPDSPVLHPGGDVAVVEFFDYQCKFCALNAPVTEQFIRRNPDVRMVYKEFPIFGAASGVAARTGLAVWQQGGAQAYHQYHAALFAHWREEGGLNTDDILRAVNAAGLKNAPDVDEAKSAAAIDRNTILAHKLGIQGTPAFIILPVEGATADNVTVIPALASLQALQDAVEKARTLKAGG